MSRIASLAEIEQWHILNTLAQCGNNRTHAARALGLSVRCLRIKLHEYERAGVTVPGPNAGRVRNSGEEQPGVPSIPANQGVIL